MFFIASTFFILSYVEANMDEIESHTPHHEERIWFDSYFALLFLIAFLIFILQPFFNCFYKRARFELLVVIFNIVIAPFGSVRFRDFFFADILTSAGTTLKDVGIIFQLINEDNWTNFNSEITRNLEIYFYVVGILPFWWRFW